MKLDIILTDGTVIHIVGATFDEAVMSWQRCLKQRKPFITGGENRAINPDHIIQIKRVSD